MSESTPQTLEGRAAELLELMVDITLVEPDGSRDGCSAPLKEQVCLQPAALLVAQALELLGQEWVLQRLLCERRHRRVRG